MKKWLLIVANYILFSKFLLLITYFHLLQLLVYPIRWVSRKLFIQIESTIADVLGGYQRIGLRILSLNKIKIHRYGQVSEVESLGKGNQLVFANHISSSDWLLMYCFLADFKRVGNVRFFLKKEHGKVPILGTASKLREMIFIAKDLEIDTETIQDSLKRFKSYNQSMWLMLYPEGTYATPSSLELLEKSQKFAKNAGLPVFHNVLTPRSKGFQLCVHPKNRHMFEYVIDVTLAFDGCSAKVGEQFLPSMVSIFALPPKAVPFHCHTRVFKVSEIPQDPEEQEKWLSNVWQGKEKLLDHFNKHGKFPDFHSSSPISFFDVFSFFLVAFLELFVSYKVWSSPLYWILIAIHVINSLSALYLYYYDYIHQHHVLVVSKNKKE